MQRARGEVGPRRGMGGDGAEELLALCEQHILHRLGKRCRAAEGLAGVDEMRDLVEQGGEVVGVREAQRPVVVRAEEIVVCGVQR